MMQSSLFFRERSLLIAWALGTMIPAVIPWLMTSQIAPNAANQEFISYFWIRLIGGIFASAYLLLMVRMFHGNNTAWGYLWRAIVIFLIAVLMTAPLKDRTSTLLHSAVLIIVCPLIAWVIFKLMRTKTRTKGVM
jgi:hypothetical protein